MKKCLTAINDRKKVALEPLYSLKRLVQAKRKRSIKETEKAAHYSRFQYLDLANDIYQEQEENFCPSYRVSFCT